MKSILANCQVILADNLRLNNCPVALAGNGRQCSFITAFVPMAGTVGTLTESLL
jgi:hypothetical protein